MHFYCKCGKRISDTTDEISYKARMIADQDWLDLPEKISINVWNVDGFSWMVKRINRMHIGMMRRRTGWSTMG